MCLNKVNIKLSSIVDRDESRVRKNFLKYMSYYTIRCDAVVFHWNDLVKLDSYLLLYLKFSDSISKIVEGETNYSVFFSWQFIRN